MINFSKAIAELLQYLPQLRELSQRVPAVQLGVITELRPDERKAKVTTESQGGQSQSYWVECGRSQVHTDEPLPSIGTTVLVAFVNGNATDGYIIRTLPNDTNPPDAAQLSPQNDNTTSVPGDDRQDIQGDRETLIKGDEQHQVLGDLKIQCHGDELTIGCSPAGGVSGTGDVNVLAFNAIALDSLLGPIRLFARGGKIEMIAPQGFTLKQGASSLNATGDAWEWDLGGRAIHFTNATDLTVNGHSVLVVGSTDTDGDINGNRGY